MLAQKKIQAQNQSAGIKRLWLILLLGSLSAFGPLSLDMYLPALAQGLVMAAMFAYIAGSRVAHLHCSGYYPSHLGALFHRS
ncbi:hypothetical protein AB4Z45_20210 [Paenibacillus sp. MCAF9]